MQMKCEYGRSMEYSGDWTNWGQGSVRKSGEKVVGLEEGVIRDCQVFWGDQGYKHHDVDGHFGCYLFCLNLHEKGK